MGPGCAPVLLRAQGGMLCPPWVETGPFESCGLYQFIVQRWLCLSPLMSQHSRERINELVLGQMSSIVNAGYSGSKGTKYSSANLPFMPAFSYTPSISLLWFGFQFFFLSLKHFLDNFCSHLSQWELLCFAMPGLLYRIVGFWVSADSYRYWLDD